MSVTTFEVFDDGWGIGRVPDVVRRWTMPRTRGRWSLEGGCIFGPLKDERGKSTPDGVPCRTCEGWAMFFFIFGLFTDA